MKTTDAIKHPKFGTQVRLAEALGLKQPTVCNWKGSPPPLHQLRIEAMTDGELRADADAVATYPEFAKYLRGRSRKRTA